MLRHAERTQVHHRVVHVVVARPRPRVFVLKSHIQSIDAMGRGPGFAGFQSQGILTYSKVTRFWHFLQTPKGGSDKVWAHTQIHTNIITITDLRVLRPGAHGSFARLQRVEELKDEAVDRVRLLHGQAHCNRQHTGSYSSRPGTDGHIGQFLLLNTNN